MAIRPRQCGEMLFSSASTDVSTGRFKYYENNYPEYLKEDDQSREPNANTCKMIVATTWSGGQIEEITPVGLTYFVFTLQDHRHGMNDLHFNKEVQVYTHTDKGLPIRFTFNKDLDGHYIDAMVTGTALAYLKEEYKLPNESEGSIIDLIEEGTSIDPYPSS